MKIDQIIRSNRKTTSLEVKPDGRLIVRAPKAASDDLIEGMVARKADWIAKTQDRLVRQFPNLAPRTFTPGEQFWYLGEKYPLRLTDRKRPLLDLDEAFYLSKDQRNNAKEIFIEWYREETRKITADLIKNYTRNHHFNVNQVRITSARTRWGSCSSKNNLNFTYRLSMAPLEVIDYVVIHELTHLRIRNHSRAFWDAVARFKPDYKKHRKWLKAYGALLSLD